MRTGCCLWWTCSPMRPYSASASAKMRIRIIPTKSLGCWALALWEKSSTERQMRADELTTLNGCIPQPAAAEVPTKRRPAPVKSTPARSDHTVKACAKRNACASEALALHHTPDSGVSHNANGHSGSQTRQTARQAGCQVGEAIEQGVLAGNHCEDPRRRRQRGLTYICARLL
jgi:hypothetical protein